MVRFAGSGVEGDYIVEALAPYDKAILRIARPGGHAFGDCVVDHGRDRLIVGVL